jgi:hypothetical protein
MSIPDAAKAEKARLFGYRHPMAVEKAKTSKKPRKPAEAKRARAFTVRMTDEEAEIVERAAKERALDVASWIRMTAFEAAKAKASGG